MQRCDKPKKPLRSWRVFQTRSFFVESESSGGLYRTELAARSGTGTQESRLDLLVISIRRTFVPVGNGFWQTEPR